MTEDIVPQKASDIIVPKIPSKMSMIAVSGILVLFIFLLYMLYKFIRNTNKRFASIEDIVSKIVEKTNHIQHLVQMYPVQQQQQHHVATAPVHPPQVVMQQQHPQVHVPAPVAVAAPKPPEVNLDKELAEELKELKQCDDTEGRIDEKKQ